MKAVHVPDTKLDCQDLQSALDTVFGPVMLKSVHGPDTVVGDFDQEGIRTFKFCIDVCRVPFAIRYLFSGSRLHITTRQTLTKPSMEHWRITNDIRMHFLGSELLKLKPVFWLVQDSTTGHIHLGGHVRHVAYLPMPFCRIAETFMAIHTEIELRKFGACLEQLGSSN